MRRRVQARRGLKAGVAVVATLALAAVGVVLPLESASANTMSVGCGATRATDLVNAIETANRQVGGVLTVTLTAGCTYTLATIYRDPYGASEGPNAFARVEPRFSGTSLVVEGNGATITRSSGERFRFFDIDFTATVTLKNLTLTGGASPHGSGSGAWGTAGDNGGAILNGGNLTLDGVTVTGNQAGSGENGDNTGAIDGHGGGDGGRGGGIYNGGTLTISNSTISNNVSGGGGAGGNALGNGGPGGSAGDGAGIYSTGSMLITTSTVSGNSSGYPGGGGSAIDSGPSGYRGSGAGIAAGNTVTVTRSLFTGNSTGGMAGEGGAIALTTTNGRATIDDSTFDNNVAYRAGAIYISQGGATVRRSTFTRNDANGTGDRITGDVAAMDRGATMTFANVLMDDNDPSQVDCNTAYIGPAVSYSSLGGLVSDENNGCGTNSVVADPKLAALAAQGGPTSSRLPAADSAVLGAGVAAYCGTVDQRGVARPASGCDVGAVERVSVLTPGAISGPVLAAINQAKTYSSSSSNTGGGPLAYRWSVTGVPATLSSTTAASPTVTFTSGSGAASVRLNVRVANSSDSESVDLTPLTVLVPPAGNTGPTLAWTGTPASTANEGESKSYAYTASDAQGDAMTATPSCGAAATLSGATFASGVGAFTCTFPNGTATSTVSVSVQDVWTAASSVSQAVAVAEVAPTIVLSGAVTATEGSALTYSYTIHEPGSDTFTPATSCTGSGGSKVSNSDVYTGSGHDTSGSFQCRWGSGPASTAATVAANGASDSKSVTVSNVAPSVVIGGPTPVDENGAATSTYRYLLNATDPGDQTTLQYVAGTASCGGAGVGTVISADLTAVVCRFAKGPGTAQVFAQVRDPDGGLSTGGGQTVTVNNVAPTVTVSQPTGPVAEGATVNYTLTVTDPGVDTFTVTPDAGCIATNVNTSTPGRLTATIACVYPDGPATVSRSVQVGDGTTIASATISNQQVVDADPSIAASFTTSYIYQHTTGVLNLGAITEAGTDTVTSIRVNWGDGQHTDAAWPVPGGQLSHLYDIHGWLYPTIDLIDEDGTHLSRGPAGLLLPVYDTAATININGPSSVPESVATTFTFTVNETFTVNFITCYMAFGPTGIPYLVDATNVQLQAQSGSFDCTFPQSGRDHQVTVDLFSGGRQTKDVHVDNVAPVVTWDDPTPLTVTESGSTWVRFPFHASDTGTLGVAVLSYPLTGGLAHMWGCGDGNRSYADGPPTFDRNTGTGYLDCLFPKGPQSADVWLTMTDYAGATSIHRTVTVVNGAPSVTLTGPTDPVAEGSSVDFAVAITDPGLDDVTVQSRSCGPGGTVTNAWATGFTCVYDDGPNTALASITVTDGLATASDVAGVQVIDVAPTGELWGGEFYEPGQDYTLTLANYVDPGDDDIELIVIDWGDDSTSYVTDGSMSAAHTYQDTGFRTISVTVVSTDGGFDLGTKVVRDVDHSFPVITPHGDQTIERNWANGAIFYPSFEANDDRGIVDQGCWPGPYFYLGDQPMQCFATDAAGNTSWDYWTMHIVDTVKPVLSPGETRFEAESPDGAVVWFGVHVDDIGLPYPLDQQALHCTPAAGTLFPMGATPVSCSATDDGGNVGTVDFTITVSDSAGPAITVPADVAASATGPGGAVVAYPAATAYDLLWGTVPVSCTPESGSTFPLGATTVDCTAVDGAANSNTEHFTVTVTDTTEPTVTVPANLLVEPTGPDGADVTYDAPSAVDAVDGDLDPAEIDCDHASGSTFPIGVTIVTCTIDDAAGNEGSGAFTVTVQDSEAPAMTPPVEAVVSSGLPVVTAEATGSAGADVAWTLPEANDVVDGDLEVECDHEPGGTYPVGRTIVTCTAEDSTDHGASLVFAVDVVDTTAPSMGDPADLTAEATSGAGAVQTFPAPTATDLVDGNVAVVCTPASGSTFLLGTTTVTCSATDAHANSVSKSFSVTITDTTAPELNLVDLTVGATSAGGAAVAYAPVGADLVDGDIPAVCTPASGTFFALESPTTVECTATDVHGNATDGSFTVLVHGAVFAADAEAGDTEVEVSAELFEVGDYVIIAEGQPDEEVRLIGALGSIIFDAPLAHDHVAGTTVAAISPPPLQDTTAPSITAISPGTVGKGTAMVLTVDCTDAGVGVESCVAPAIDTSTAGAHTVTVRAWDWNGNLSTLALDYTVVAAGSGLAWTGGSVGPLANFALMLMIAGLAAIALQRRRRQLETVAD